MTKRIIWLLVSCLMVAALLLASCAAAEVEEEEEEEVVTPEEEEVVAEEEVVVTEEKEMVRDALGRLVEKPQYGGDFTIVSGSDVLGFDECIMTEWFAYTMNFTNDELLAGDWIKSTTGSGEDSWIAPGVFLPHMEVGCLAESWEMDDEKLVFHLRKGIHFHDKSPVNGREMTADDVVFSINRRFETPGNYLNAIVPPEDRPTVTAVDKYTVVLTPAPGQTTSSTFAVTADFARIVPREMVEEYGDLKDWKNACGTGPFLLVDYVPMSSLAFERNPNYWRKNPLHPEDTMPYIDSLTRLVIPDSSTRLAAMRTGKIDRLGVGWENAADLLGTNPELGYNRYLSAVSSNIYMRLDKPGLPWQDIKVRHALHMAIDLQAIADDYYEGNAEILTHPVVPYPEFSDLVYPFEELPESTKELFRYNPEKAKQLMIEAGYPDGFKTNIVCSAGYTDLLSIVKEYWWNNLGVDLIFDVKETAVYQSYHIRSKHEEMLIAYMDNANFLTGTYFHTGDALNASQMSDERMDRLFEELRENQFDWDWVARNWQEVTPYILEQAWSIELPTAYSYTTWQPWVKDYHGESTIGYLNLYDYPKYIWIDQDLKKEMGY